MKTIGLVICIALALFDLAGAIPVGGTVPPIGVIVVGLVLGIVTLAGMMPAWRGSRTGLLTVVASRALSALLGIGAFFDDSAPGLGHRLRHRQHGRHRGRHRPADAGPAGEPRHTAGNGLTWSGRRGESRGGDTARGGVT